MNRRSVRFRLVLLVGVLTGMPAYAQSLGDGGRMGGWTVGGLAYSAPGPAENTLSGLNSKMRLGTTSLVPQIESFATVRPWIGPGAQALDGIPRAAGSAGLAGGLTNTGVMGGILIDVPFGAFVFTPSFGAGTLPRSSRDGGATTEFRSQVELGYEFDNKSRFSLGYSRIATDGNPAEPASAPNNVFGLYYRLPFGGP